MHNGGKLGQRQTDWQKQSRSTNDNYGFSQQFQLTCYMGETQVLRSVHAGGDCAIGVAVGPSDRFAVTLSARHSSLRAARRHPIRGDFSLTHSNIKEVSATRRVTVRSTSPSRAKRKCPVLVLVAVITLDRRIAMSAPVPARSAKSEVQTRISASSSQMAKTLPLPS